TAVAATIICVLALAPSFRRWAIFALACMHISIVARQFDEAGNHAYLEILICLLIASFDAREEEQQSLFLVGMRWMVVVVRFHSWLEKVVHGYYLYGQFFALLVQQESFRNVLRYLLSADELQRLAALRGVPGDGPYALSSPLGLMVSNGVWIGEITL